METAPNAVPAVLGPAVTPTAVGLRYGLLTGLVGTIVSFVLNATHLEQSPAKWLSVVVLGVGMVLAQQFYKKARAGFMSYGEGLGIGLTMAAVTGVVSAVFSYIYTHFVDTDMMPRILAKVQTDMEERAMTADQIEQAMGWTRTMLTEPLASVFLVVFSLLIGLVLALVVSAILKNPKPEFE